MKSSVSLSHCDCLSEAAHSKVACTVHTCIGEPRQPRRFDECHVVCPASAECCIVRHRMVAMSLTGQRQGGRPSAGLCSWNGDAARNPCAAVGTIAERGVCNGSGCDMSATKPPDRLSCP